MNYPKTKRMDHFDQYHGTSVSDPYRWLEDMNSLDTKAWVKTQNQLTMNYLREIPERKRIIDRLQTLWNFEHFSVPEHRGGRYFFQHNTGISGESVTF